MQNVPLYSRLAGLVQAYWNCRRTDNEEWLGKHEAEIQKLVLQHLPKGSGFDDGTQIVLERSTSARLIFESAFHVMNDAGIYTHWVSFVVVVQADLAHGFDLRVVGPFSRTRQQHLKDYILETFDYVLRREV